MLTKITGRHMEVTAALRSYVEKKITRLEKYNHRVSEIEVILDSEAMVHNVEIILKVDNHPPFVVSNSAEDAYACIDEAIDKIERQLIKYKEKVRSRKGRASAAEATADAIEAQAASEETDTE